MSDNASLSQLLILGRNLPSADSLLACCSLRRGSKGREQAHVLDMWVCTAEAAVQVLMAPGGMLVASRVEPVGANPALADAPAGAAVATHTLLCAPALNRTVVLASNHVAVWSRGPCRSRIVIILQSPATSGHVISAVSIDATDLNDLRAEGSFLVNAPADACVVLPGPLVVCLIDGTAHAAGVGIDGTWQTHASSVAASSLCVGGEGSALCMSTASGAVLINEHPGKALHARHLISACVYQIATTPPMVSVVAVQRLRSGTFLVAFSNGLVAQVSDGIVVHSAQLPSAPISMHVMSGHCVIHHGRAVTSIQLVDWSMTAICDASVVHCGRTVYGLALVCQSSSTFTCRVVDMDHFVDSQLPSVSQKRPAAGSESTFHHKLAKALNSRLFGRLDGMRKQTALVQSKLDLATHCALLAIRAAYGIPTKAPPTHLLPLANAAGAPAAAGASGALAVSCECALVKLCTGYVHDVFVLQAVIRNDSTATWTSPTLWVLPTAPVGHCPTIARVGSPVAPGDTVPLVATIPLAVALELSSRGASFVVGICFQETGTPPRARSWALKVVPFHLSALHVRAAPHVFILPDAAGCSWLSVCTGLHGRQPRWATPEETEQVLVKEIQLAEAALSAGFSSSAMLPTMTVTDASMQWLL